MKSPAILTPVDRLQQQLAKHCFWDEVEQVLYIDARKFFPKAGVVTILGWDNMMMNAQAIPDYPAYFKMMHWAKHGHLADWLKQIPNWVQESCGLFPSHQMALLHYAGKYPQVLELLDHAPMLAWRLVSSGLEEPEIVALLSGKRTQIAETIGWPGKADAVKFLTNLRLRWVDKDIADQVETCLLDEQRLTALQDLPRINSMALSLAARFPELIGSQLHRALAQLPCRPMQCKSMIALLEDIYRLADYLKLPVEETDKVGQCRYLVEVNQLYQAWLNSELDKLATQLKLSLDDALNSLEEILDSQPQMVQDSGFVLKLSVLSQHAWFTDFNLNNFQENESQLVAWQDEEGVWVAITHSQLAEKPQQSEFKTTEHSVVRVRGKDNCLPGAKQLSTLHLWQAQQMKQAD